MTSLILRIFSGKHYGAEIELPPGIWVIGSDDSCDIILNDSSLRKRHVALNITENGATLKVEATNLDGDILQFDAESGPVNNLLTALTPYRLGSVIFAWLISPAESADWKAVMDLLKSRKPNEAQVQVGESQTVETAPAQLEQSQSETENNSAEPTNDDDDTVSSKENAVSDTIREQRPNRKRMYATMGILAVAVLAIGSLAYHHFETKSTTKPSIVEEMTLLLTNSGYQDLKVIETAKDRLLISGSVANDSERGRLLKLAESFQYPTEFSIKVDSDAAQALEAGFNAQNLWPVVYTQKISGEKILLVKGYIQDPRLESKAFTRAIENVPELQQESALNAVKRTIRYEGDLRPIIQRTLANSSLTQTQVNFRPGHVELELALTPAREDALKQVLEKLRTQLDVPVRIEVKNSNKKETSIHNYTSTTASQADSLPTFRVVSTSMGALKFITLSSGEKVFEGGRLPGGFVLDNIHLDKLILSKNNKKTTYPLKVRK